MLIATGPVFFLVLESGHIDSAPPTYPLGEIVTVSATVGIEIEGDPASIEFIAVAPDETEVSNLCGVRPELPFPAPDPWPHPLPVTCSLDILLERPGTYHVILLVHYLHEAPDVPGAYYFFATELDLRVDELPIFNDGFETGDTTRWSSSVP